MIHACEDYNRIQDPANKIGQDEPVFLLRGTDKFSPYVIRMWAALVKTAGDRELAEHVDSFANRMVLWQHANGCKTPDMPIARQR